MLQDLLIREVGARGAASRPKRTPGAVDAGGADVVEAPPQAATMTAMLAKMPKSRFCMNCPPNGWLYPIISRYRGPIRACQRRHVRPASGSSLPLETVHGRAAATARFGSVRCRYYPQRLIHCQLPT